MFRMLFTFNSTKFPISGISKLDLKFIISCFDLFFLKTIFKFEYDRKKRQKLNLNYVKFDLTRVIRPDYHSKYVTLISNPSVPPDC